MTFHKTIFRTLLLALSVSAVACTSNFEQINTNPGDATPDDMDKDGYIIGALLTTLQSNIVPVDVFASQFIDGLCGCPFGGYFADSGTWEYRITLYNATDDWMKPAFADIIPKIFTNYSKLYSVTDNVVVRAVADVLRVAAMHRVTDIFGPIPYSQMGVGGKLNAPYDSQEKAYEEMFKTLDGAIGVLEANRTVNFNANADKVYRGSAEKWFRYANSLKLRMAMRLTYAAPSLAQQKAEEAAPNTIANNADNAYMPVASNPHYIRLYDWNNGESRISADILSYMNGYQDPRRAAYFTPTTYGFYGGLRSGIANSSVNKSTDYYSNMKVQLNTPLLWMNASEVAFLKAEGALRGWAMGDTAENFYNKGIELSFDENKVSGYSDYKSNSSREPLAYNDPSGRSENNAGKQASICVAWKNGADLEENLEQIITQKWIAIFPVGHEAWAEFRRTGYPRLLASPIASGMGIALGGYPARLPYPQDEFYDNKEHYLEGVSLLGGSDNMATRLWWDCKTKN